MTTWRWIVFSYSVKKILFCKQYFSDSKSAALQHWVLLIGGRGAAGRRLVAGDIRGGAPKQASGHCVGPLRKPRPGLNMLNKVSVQISSWSIIWWWTYINSRLEAIFSLYSRRATNHLVHGIGCRHFFHPFGGGCPCRLPNWPSKKFTFLPTHLTVAIGFNLIEMSKYKQAVCICWILKPWQETYANPMKRTNTFREHLLKASLETLRTLIRVMLRYDLTNKNTMGKTKT